MSPELDLSFLPLKGDLQITIAAVFIMLLALTVLSMRSYRPRGIPNLILTGLALLLCILTICECNMPRPKPGKTRKLEQEDTPLVNFFIGGFAWKTRVDNLLVPATN